MTDTADVGRAIAEELHAANRIPSGGQVVEVHYVTVARVRVLNSDCTQDTSYEIFRSPTVEPDAELGMVHKLLAEAQRRMGI